MVRVPIGYWAYQSFGEPFVSGQAEYLDRAIEWARSTGLRVMIDLHGAPLSQNGFDNSGHRLEPPLKPKFLQGDSTAQTLRVIQQMADKDADSSYDDVVMGIELLNEPMAPKLDKKKLKQFWRDGYANIRSKSSGRAVVIEDGFLEPSSLDGFLSPSNNGSQNVAIDRHEYQVFSNDMVSWTPRQHKSAVCSKAAGYAGSDKWSFVVEWTGAMTDCAAWLNGEWHIKTREASRDPVSSTADR